MFRMEGDREKGAKRKKKSPNKRLFPHYFSSFLFLSSSSIQFSTEFRYQEKKC